MALTATVQTAAAGRACPDCHRPIEATRRYCDRDRDRRRALTFARQAHDLAIDAGLDAVAGRLGVIVGELEAPVTT